MQKHNLVRHFLDRHLIVGNVVEDACEFVQFVIVGRENGAGADFAGEIFCHGPGNGEAIEGGGAPSDFVEEHQGAIAGVIQYVRRLVHLDHEGGLSGRQVIDGTHAGEDAIANTQPCRTRWHETAHLGHELNQAHLPEIAAFAAGVGAGEDDEVGVEGVRV